MSLLDDLAGTGTESVPCCLICESPGVRDARWERLLALEGPFGVLRCECGLRWLSPRPTPLGYQVIYSDKYYFAVNDRLGSAFVPQRMADFERRLSSLSRPGLKLLDYGAATGDFVRLARDMGIEADGMEFSEDARRRALEVNGVELLPVRTEFDKKYDVIHMSHVLEHIGDPLHLLAGLGNALVQDGMLIVEVPNQFENAADTMRRWAGKSGGRQAGFDSFSLHHTYFFTQTTLCALGEKAGITTESVRSILTSPPSEMSLTRRLIERGLHVLNKGLALGDAIEWVGRPKHLANAE